MPSPILNSPVFDPAAIERLRKVAGDQDSGFVAEMAQLFDDEAQKSVTELKSATDRGDWRTVSRLAHSLKSSAATLGLMRLSSACLALELDTHSYASTPETAALVTDVMVEHSQAAPILKTLL